MKQAKKDQQQDDLPSGKPDKKESERAGKKEKPRHRENEPNPAGNKDNWPEEQISGKGTGF